MKNARKHMCYPFMYQNTLLTDYEIESDLLASQLGLCASLATDDLKTHLLLMVSCAYEINGSIRGHDTINQLKLSELEKTYNYY